MLPCAYPSLARRVPIRASTTSALSSMGPNSSSCFMEALHRGAYIHNLYYSNMYSNIIRGASLSSPCPACSPSASLAAAAGPPAVSGIGHVTANVHLPAPGIAGTFRNIVRHEGTRVLWSGLDTAMLLSVPMVGIYMPLYDYLHSRLRPELGFYTPAVAGMVARAVAVSLTAPLELIRTRQQASQAPRSNAPWWQQQQLRAGSGAHASTSGAGFLSEALSDPHVAAQRLRSMVPRVRGMFTGLGATLARDVPFTALYWCGVEPIRGSLLAHHPPSPRSSLDPLHHAPSSAPSEHSASDVFLANLTAGAVSGALAAAATTPFDVVKTRLQTATPHSATALHISEAASKCLSRRHHLGQALQGISTLNMLRVIWHTEGAAGLWAGVVPRVARSAPACAIVIATYEVIKTSLAVV
jgi:solute carrier family 25 protein 39/40